MNTSETTTEITKALLAAQRQFVPVPKNKTAKVRMKTGGEYTYKYADLADVLQMALPVLNANDIFFSQPHMLVGETLRVVTRLAHVSGEWQQSDGVLVREHDDPQVFGASSTYMRRYDVCSMLGIAPDEDTDANVASAHAGPQAVQTSRFVKPAPVKPPVVNQDADDDPLFDETGDMVPATKVPPPAQPRYEPPSVKPASGPTISAAQAKRWFAICKQNEKTEEEMRGALQSIGVKRSADIPKDQYDTFIEWAGGKNEARA